MALDPDEFRSGGQVFDGEGRRRIVLGGGAGLAAGEYRSGGIVVDADGREVISAASGGVGGGAGLPANVLTKTANYTAVAGDFVLADSSGGAFTVTLPAGTAGDLVTVKKTDASTNAVLVESGGTIDGDADGASITAQHFGAVFEATAANVWKIVAITAGGSNGADGAPGADGVISEVQNEGVALADQPIMDFVGAGVDTTVAGGKYVVTIPGGSPALSPLEQGRVRFDLFDDLVGTMSSAGHLLLAASTGGGAGVTQQVQDTANRVGIQRASTGTTSTGVGRIVSAQANMLSLGAGVTVFEAAVKVTTLSDATERFAALVGFSDTVTNGGLADACAFVYDEGGAFFSSSGAGSPSAASPNWQIATASNSNRTYATTTVAVVAGSWVTLRIDVNAAGTSAGFYIDDVLVHTATVNIPVGVARATGLATTIMKTIGTTARTIDVDYMATQIDFTTPRAT